MFGKNAKNGRGFRVLAAVLLLGGALALSSCGSRVVAHTPKTVLDIFSLFSLTQAQQQTDAALALAAEKGHAEAMRQITREKAFWDGDSYVFVIDVRTKKIAAHPVDPSLIGQIVGTISSERVGREILATDEKGRWVEYEWNNPKTGEVERKISWVKLSGHYIYGSGAYEKGE
ncbi:MAG: cache domain-containing protein [Gammaproteobacteria bacterium]